ncbi:hypothetical protein CFOL_v3_30375, partial [Cephalotus follicularis]
TISNSFHKVLKATCRLEKLIITLPNFDIISLEIEHNPKYFPLFEDCVGSIDETLINAHILANQQIPYRGRK